MSIHRIIIGLSRQNLLKVLCFMWVILLGTFVIQIDIKAKNSNVIAKIDQFEITENDLQQRLDKLPENQRVMYETKTGKKELLQEMVRLEVFYREALEMQLNKKRDYKDKIERISKGLLASAFVKENILANNEIDEADVELFYRSHREQYIEPEKIKVKSIFFQVNEKQPLKSARDKAQKTLARIQKGESFALLSEQMSENETPVKQDYFSKGRLDPVIEDRVFELNIGETSDVLQVEDGLILFQMEDKIAAKQLGFHEVKEKILETLKEEKIKETFYATEKQLFKKYQVSFNDINKTQAAMDGKKPDIQGTIDRIYQSDDPNQAVISRLEVGNLHVLITSDTVIYEKRKSSNHASSINRLQVGQKVDVYSTGPVMQSFPPQARAVKIVILDVE